SSSVRQVLTTDGSGQSATGTCMDLAGNSVSDTQTGINIDRTPPTAIANATPLSNNNGWNNGTVNVTFSGTDALSGIDFCTATKTLTSDGAGQSASGTCRDKAGNLSATATASGINIDATPPVVTINTPASVNYVHTDILRIDWNVSDVLSGI